ncbi:MAG: single-stranded-DNA-specific exonuclease RecJ [Planctomycetota bacterium]|nr:single-stranded-DNA-specific exonuclease RecJ [Planctomycetota bacterium]
MSKRWIFRAHDSAGFLAFADELKVDPVVSQLLLSRGISKVDAARLFLECKFSDLRDPQLLPGIDAAAERILKAVRDSEPIVIYGDYDADGMCATAILESFLRMLGADVSYYVPNRLEDAYGLSCESIRRLASLGRKLLVTVDCGIGSIQEAQLCRELGLDLIITDHHACGETLPDALAIVHPNLPNSNYPFHGLCGAGVAFKLAWRMSQILADNRSKVADVHRDFLLMAMTIATIATVADVVPLIDENRILVRTALQLMTKHGPLGLKELIKLTKLDSKRALSAEDIAFTLAPRLNAAGRLGQAQLGVELLTTQDPGRALALAQYLDRLNADRDSIERSITMAASKQAKEQLEASAEPALVLHSPGWHLGVIGIVAGRLAERFHRPVVIISSDLMGQKPATGSGRSAGIVDLHRAFVACSEHLESCGGHAAAAGLRIQDRKIPEFREALCDHVRTATGERDPEQTLLVDAEATFQELSLQTVSMIESMAPFGAGNPRPIFVASNVQLHEMAKLFGQGDRHVGVRFKQHNQIFRAVAFSQPEWAEKINAHQGQFDLAFRPNVNEFNGYRRVELQLVDWRASQVD